MRQYKDSDYEWLKDMLLKEGIKEEEMGFDKHLTFIVGKSFFTLKSDKGFLHLVHFCVDRKYRSVETMRTLLKAINEVVVGKLIIHSNKEYLNKVIEYYYKEKPYESENGINFYLVKMRKSYNSQEVL
jgi:hypothetical protein